MFEKVSVCVCVCACVRVRLCVEEREREKDVVTSSERALRILFERVDTRKKINTPNVSLSRVIVFSTMLCVEATILR